MTWSRRSTSDILAHFRESLIFELRRVLAMVSVRDLPSCRLVGCHLRLLVPTPSREGHYAIPMSMYQGMSPV